jgi:hypothetical protein
MLNDGNRTFKIRSCRLVEIKGVALLHTGSFDLGQL